MECLSVGSGSFDGPAVAFSVAFFAEFLRLSRFNWSGEDRIEVVGGLPTTNVLESVDASL